MDWKLDIKAPVNGRIHKATVTVRDDDGKICFTDKADLAAIPELKKLANRLAERLKANPVDIAQKLEDGWAAALNAREQQSKQAGSEATNDVAVEVLDDAPAVVRKPLSLVNGRGYA